MAGSQRATTVEVVGNSLILAKLPKAPAQPKGKTEYSARVQVFTGGEALTACEDCFKYVAPFEDIADNTANTAKTAKTAKTAAFSATLKTNEGAPGDCINIETSQAVPQVDLKGIQVGDTVVPINKINIKEKTITLTAPVVKAADCAGKGLEVTLLFYANSKIAAGDQYKLKDTFKPKSSTCSNNTPTTPTPQTGTTPKK